MNRQTIDALIRHQIYVEGYKNDQHKQFDRLAEDIEAVLVIALLRLGVKRLSDLPKKKLNVLVATLRKRLGARYDSFSKRFTADVKGFAATDYAVIKSILSKTGDAARVRENKTDQKAFWSSVSNAIIPGVGLTIAEALKGLSTAHVAAIVKIVKQAYADKLTPQQAISLILRAGVGGSKGWFKRAKAQTHSVIETVIQHASAAAVALFGGLLSERYQWVSVLDSRTTDVCRSRNGRVYLYSTGPRPPAHYNCRSTIVPYAAGVVIPKSYGAWLATQPRAFIADIVGSGNKIPVEKFEKFVNRKRLTEDQFKNKLGLMLAE